MPFQANVQVTNFAFSQGDDSDAGERKALEEPCGVLLVTAESVQRLSEHNVDITAQRRRHQSLEAGAEQCRARHR